MARHIPAYSYLIRSRSAISPGPVGCHPSRCPRLRTRRRKIHAGKRREPSEMTGGLLRRQGNHRHLQTSADDFCDITHRDAFFGDRVVPRAGCLASPEPAGRDARHRTRAPPASGFFHRRHRPKRASRAGQADGVSVTKPCLTVSWTCGSRTTDTLTPAADIVAPASSDATRGFGTSRIEDVLGRGLARPGAAHAGALT